MRVLHILPQRKNSRIENYAADVILGLQQADLEQYVIIDPQSPRLYDLQKSGVKTSSRLLRASLPLLRRFWMQSLIARMRPDIAHCWSRVATGLIPAGKMPVIGWLAGYDDPVHLPRCTHFVSASRDSALRLAKGSNAGTKAQFIPPFSEASTAAPIDRHRLATPRAAKVLLNPAPLHPDSQHETLLMALRHLPECMAWLVGDGPYRRVLERKARDFGVIDRVRFAPVSINPGALLRAADLCVLTAADRPFGTLVPQAWAAGTPVIASQRKGLTPPLDDGINGLLIATGDETAFIEAVRQLLDEKTLRSRLTAKGYAAYLGHYAHEAVIRQWMDLYRHIAVH